MLTQYLTVTSSNVKQVADHISPTADIQEMVIHFKPGPPGEMLLSVPLYWLHCPDSVIAIVLTIENEYPNQYEHDLFVGISDSTALNLFFIVGAKDYEQFPPCYPLPFGDHDDLAYSLVSDGSLVPHTFEMGLQVKYKFGSCKTAQEGGYSNVGIFREKLDMSKPVSIKLYRHNPWAHYYVYAIGIITKENC